MCSRESENEHYEHCLVIYFKNQPDPDESNQEQNVPAKH